MRLEELGNELVRCSLNCDGIANKPDKGIIPRGLLYEQRAGIHNVMVVGLNPGKCNGKERKYYLDNGVSFQSLQDYFIKGNIYKRSYFQKTRELIDVLGYGGDILWTDLVKCECSGQNGVLPIQTLRVCINRFLRKEIALFSAEVIFSLGNRAFDFCALSFPERFVIGLPHPSGAWSARIFDKLKQDINKKPEIYKARLKVKRDRNQRTKALRLSAVLD